MSTALEVATRLMSIPGVSAFVADDDDRPDLVIVEPEIGIVCVEFSRSLDDDQHVRVRLNRKIALLRNELTESERVPLVRGVVAKGDLEAEAGSSMLILRTDALPDGSWLRQLPHAPVDREPIDALLNRLSPAVVFKVKARAVASDDGAENRHQDRLVLDNAQAALATGPLNDVCLVTGPPGSGKTLLLAARARWLLTEHPGWRVQVVCFNRELAGYLCGLLGDLEGLDVDNFNAFARKNGHRFSKPEESVARRELSTIKSRGIAPSFDAILVDEWQDFCPSWIEYCLDLLVPGHGGLLAVGDSNQAIYQSEAPRRVLRGRDVVLRSVTRPYRSTRQVLEFVQTLEPEFETEGTQLAPEGPPVDLIHADSWDLQAEAAAWETQQLIETNQRLPSDIGILCTRRSLIYRLERELIERDVPFRLVGGNEAQADPATSVTVSTIHAAKGLEFNVVILVGLDAVEPLDTVDLPQKSRIGYVGPTRARDQLLATFTKSSTLIKRLRKCAPGIIAEWEYPESYVGGARG